MDFSIAVYQISETFPLTERYGLISQLRRSSVSIVSNISEGAGRASSKEFKRFLEISMGSMNEAQTQIEIAFRLSYLLREKYEVLIQEAEEIYKMILGFYRSLN